MGKQDLMTTKKSRAAAAVKSSGSSSPKTPTMADVEKAINAAPGSLTAAAAKLSSSPVKSDYDIATEKIIAVKGGKPVSFLSTENAVDTTNKNLDKLNTYSPTTAPGYVAPTTPTKETAKPKTLKFVNDAGQTITLTDQEMYDQSKVDMLKNGGYVFSEGETTPPAHVTEPTKTKTGYWSIVNGVRKWNDTSGTGLGPNGESAKQMAAQEAQDRLERQIEEFNNWVPEDDLAFQGIANGIRAQYDQLRSQMQKTNDARAKAYETAGMRGGTSEFAGGVQMSIEGEELNQANARIAELTRQENAAITDARVAYEEGKWVQFNKQIDILEKRREEKMEELKAYNETLAEAIKVEREKERLSNIEIGVANSVATGDTDPLSVYANLKMAGIDATTEEVSTIIKSLTGNYGSGIIGEYNFYKAQELAAGNEPLSFDAYQTRDANRKIAAANASASVNGLTSSQLAALDKKNTWLASQPVVKDFQTIQGKYMDVVKAIKQGGGAADIAVIYDLMKTLDPTSVVRDTEYETGAKRSGNIFAGAYAQYNGYLKPEGGFVSDAAKAQIQNVVTSLYENKRREYTNIRDQVVKDLENRNVANADDYVYDYDLHADVINEQNFTEDDLIAFYQKQSPEIQAMMDKIEKEQPGLSPYDIYQIANVAI